VTWLHVPQSICAPATAALSLPCGRGEYAPWLTLSGTATQRPSSWSGWNNRDWIKPLFGTTSQPLMANLGVAVWISSLPVSLASLSPQPAQNVDLTTTVGSGLQSQELLLRYDPDSSSWKTCHQLFEQDYPLFSQTLPNSGSMRNGACTPQPMLEPLTDGNVGGAWPTPVANDDNKTPEAHLAMKARMGGNRTAITSLNVISKLWPTPTGMDSRASGGNPTTTGTHGETLTDATARMWPTPQAADGHKIGSMTPETATRQAAADHQEMLMGAAVLWPTPCARDAKGKPGPNAQMETLPGIASHQHATTPTAGNSGSTKVDLNPWFVASLMGLPADWLTHCTSAVTDSCRKQQQKQLDNYSTGAGGSYE